MAKKRPGVSPTFCQVWAVPRGMKTNEPGDTSTRRSASWTLNPPVQDVDSLVLISMHVQGRPFCGRGARLERCERSVSRLGHALEDKNPAYRILDREALVGCQRE